MSLNKNFSVKSKKKRIGRGIGSGKGKTSGRGVKGQKSRSGVAIKSFEGGQMPLYRRLPKRGFNPIYKKNTATINLEKLQRFIDNKKINIESKINLDVLKNAKIIRKSFKKLKVLGTGELKSKIEFQADYASKSAMNKIEKNVGKILINKAN